MTSPFEFKGVCDLKWHFVFLSLKIHVRVLLTKSWPERKSLLMGDCLLLLYFKCTIGNLSYNDLHLSACTFHITIQNWTEHFSLYTRCNHMYGSGNGCAQSNSSLDRSPMVYLHRCLFLFPDLTSSHSHSVGMNIPYSLLLFCIHSILAKREEPEKLPLFWLRGGHNMVTPLLAL